MVPVPISSCPVLAQEAAMAKSISALMIAAITALAALAASAVAGFNLGAADEALI